MATNYSLHLHVHHWIFEFVTATVGKSKDYYDSPALSSRTSWIRSGFGTDLPSVDWYGIGISSAFAGFEEVLMHCIAVKLI